MTALPPPPLGQLRWNQQQRYWSRAYPTDSYSEEKLIAKPWYHGKVQVEVGSDTGEILRPLQTNSD